MSRDEGIPDVRLLAQSSNMQELGYDMSKACTMTHGSATTARTSVLLSRLELSRATSARSKRRIYDEYA